MDVSNTFIKHKKDNIQSIMKKKCWAGQSFIDDKKSNIQVNKYYFKCVLDIYSFEELMYR